MSELLETNFNLASKILFRRNGPARLRNFQAMSFPLQYLSARHVFMLFFLLFPFCFGLFSALSVCFVFLFLLFTFPYFQTRLFISSNFAKCFQVCRARALMICCAWRWLKIMTPSTGSEIARLATRVITPKIGPWALKYWNDCLTCVRS